MDDFNAYKLAKKLRERQAERVEFLKEQIHLDERRVLGCRERITKYRSRIDNQQKELRALMDDTNG